mmetsp:Transcript_30749/g.89329  ORF Transcript_30749/g.89329 Transcript_30749/m.89329 type:complete len:245 (-) Transcript_30749:27-761(-)
MLRPTSSSSERTCAKYKPHPRSCLPPPDLSSTSSTSSSHTSPFSTSTRQGPISSIRSTGTSLTSQQCPRQGACAPSWALENPSCTGNSMPVGYHASLSPEDGRLPQSGTPAWQWSSARPMGELCCGSPARTRGDPFADFLPRCLGTASIFLVRATSPCCPSKLPASPRKVSLRKRWSQAPQLRMRSASANSSRTTALKCPGLWSGTEMRRDGTLRWSSWSESCSSSVTEGAARDNRHVRPPHRH